MKREYSFSALKGVDWDELSGRYREAAESAETVEAFASVVREMLGELNDIHVWIELPDGRSIHTYSSSYHANYDYGAVAERLKDLRRFGRLGFTGRTAEGFGVVVVRALPPDQDELYRELTDAIRGMFDAPAFIVDLRANAGGAEPRAAQIAGLFTDRERFYARSKVRSGPGVADFREAPPRRLSPTAREPFTRPVVCLIGHGCVSSGEGFALMMKAMDHVTLVGQPTRGASGNPRPVTLSNGVSVWFSRWVSMDLSGVAIEGRGVEPDLTVTHAGPGDPTFQRAVDLLRAKTGDAGVAIE